MQSIQRAKPLIIPLACSLPPFVAYSAYKNYDSREISKDEIHLSHRRLASLQAMSGATDIDMKKKNRRLKEVKKSQQNVNNNAPIQSCNLLQKSGVTFLPGLLDDDQLKSWNKNLNDAMNTRNTKKRPHNNRGRLHSHQESRRDPYNPHFHQLISSLPEIEDIVELYFKRNSISKNNYRLTQTQFLLAKPGSQHQIWHRDNVAPGLTLLVALDDVTCNGPTELLLGSHREDDDDDVNDDEVLLGCICAGDAILYDARVIHRGRGYGHDKNESDCASDRPVLVLRWDAVSTPPPGAGFIVTNYVDCLGSFRIFVKTAQDLVQSLFGQQ